MALSPMMQQYFDIKNRYGKYLLFYRVGDFYEMFFDDARTASRELDLVLTGKDCGLEERAPMCGVPYHSCDGYIARLIERGYKVAICEQTEDPATAKGLVRREIVRVVTPGTLSEPDLLQEGQSSHLASVYCAGGAVGLAFADVSTGGVWATVTTGGLSAVTAELSRFRVREFIVNPGFPPALRKALEAETGLNAEEGAEEDYRPETADARLADSFAAEPETGAPEARLALCAAVGYIEDVYKGSIRFGEKVEWYNADRFMNLDATARRNLELERTLRGERRGSLLWVLDRTRTAMGRRLLGEYLSRPLLDCALIGKRLNAVGELNDNDIVCNQLGDALDGIFDIERIVTRISYGSANARELRSLSQTLARLPALKNTLSGLRSALLREADAGIDLMQDVQTLIDGALVDDPPVLLTEGGLIRRGYHAEADRLWTLLHDSQKLLGEIEAEEKEKTGLKQLKIGYNRVFGYYLEVSRSNLGQVPDYFIRKQTLTGAERFITPRLKELENDIVSAKSRLTALEYELFVQLRAKVAESEARIRLCAQSLAALDVFVSLAETARRNHYCRPDVDESDSLIVRGGRHPVVERTLSGEGFVPNDTLMDRGENKVLIITGPNMAGKSTYMRQNALIVIMAQIGSFVPAESAQVGVVDAVFTRVGASDDLSGGRSTFMVEMTELAYILKNATGRSLILLDEIGRGTSTFDGMSIAQAVAEAIAEDKKRGARTLFATHYHELCMLEERLPGVKNYNILVRKRGDEITFLRRIARGGADDSYGIEVGKLAGLPAPILRRAHAILAELEAGKDRRVWSDRVGGDGQGALNDDRREAILQKLQGLDPNTLTPMDALLTLGELSAAAKEL